MSDPESRSNETVAYREPVDAVAGALRELHRALVDATRGLYEAEHGPIEGPSQMLHVLMHDPEFEWLRELSALMVDVDELLDLAEITERDAAAVRVEVERLIAAPAGATGFAAHYREALQADTNVVIVHGRTRAALAALPAPDERRDEAADHRRTWSGRRIDERRR